MIPTKLDPITIDQTKDFLKCIMTFDFVKIIKTQQSVANAAPALVAKTETPEARILLQDTMISERFEEVGIHKMFILNIIFHFVFAAIPLIVMIIAKLMVSANTTKTSTEEYVGKALQGVLDNPDVEKKETDPKNSGKHSGLVQFLSRVYLYLNMSGLIDFIRLVLPQALFISIAFIRFFKKDDGVWNILIPGFCVMIALVMIAQLFMIGSYKLVGSRNYGGNIKLDRLELEKQKEEERKRM